MSSAVFNGGYPAFQNCGCTLLRWPIKDGVLNEGALNPVSGDWSIKPGTRTLRTAIPPFGGSNIFSRPGCGAAYGQRVSFDVAGIPRDIWCRVYLGATTDYLTWLAVDRRHWLKMDGSFQCYDLRFVQSINGEETVLRRQYIGAAGGGLLGAIDVSWSQESGWLSAGYTHYGLVAIEIEDPSPFRCQWGIGIIAAAGGSGFAEFPNLTVRAMGRLHTAIGCKRRCSVNVAPIRVDLPSQESSCGNGWENTDYERPIGWRQGNGIPGDEPNADAWGPEDASVLYSNANLPGTGLPPLGDMRLLTRWFRVYDCDNEVTIRINVNNDTCSGCSGEGVRVTVGGLALSPTNDFGPETMVVYPLTEDSITFLNLPLGIYYMQLSVDGHPINGGITSASYIEAASWTFDSWDGVEWLIDC